MLNDIITILTNFIVHIISIMGYAGIVLLMAIESAAVPLPSEIIMPFAGFAVLQGRFTLFGIALAGALGSMLGSAATYYIGLYGGRPFVEKYGKYLLISRHDLELADKFFAKFGILATFIGRLLPVVRTFISIPAGISRVPIIKFLFYSFVGSFLWSYLLGYFGMILGANWMQLRERFHGLDIAVVVLLVIGVAWWIYRHFRHQRLLT